MYRVSLLKLLLITELLIFLAIGLVSLKRTVFADREGVRRFQAGWIADKGEAAAKNGGKAAIRAGTPGSSAGVTSDTGPGSDIPVISADLLSKDYDSGTVTGAFYLTDYTEDVMDRLSIMSTEEKIDILIVDSTRGGVETLGLAKARYPGEADSDRVTASINAGETYLYYTDDPEGLKKALKEAASRGDILAEALDKAAGAAITIYNEAEYSVEAEVPGDQGNPENAEAASGESGEAAEENRKPASKKKTAKSSASSGSSSEEAAAQAALQQQLAEQIQKALIEQASAAAETAQGSGSTQEGNAQ